jgi:hypothetical protein
VTQVATGLSKVYHFAAILYLTRGTDKKENQIFLKYKEIQNEQLQSHMYMTNGLLIYGEIFAHFLRY